MFKKLFGRSDEPPPDEARSIEDLIVLEQWDDAERRLKMRLQENPEDLHSHIKLADVYTALRQVDKAADAYVYVAEEYARDGFYDKGIALLSRARRLLPANDKLPVKIEAFRLAKRLEHKRIAAVDGMRQGSGSSSEIGNRVLLLERVWHNLVASALVQRLAADQIRRLFVAFEPLQMESGDVIAQEGMRRDALFLVVTGTVEASIPAGEDSQVSVRHFGPRDILGDAALFEHAPWPAAYTIAERAVVLRLDREGLEQALVGNPDPRALLEALREQRTDREVKSIVAKLRARS